MALVLGLLTVSLAPTVTNPPGDQSPAGFAGLRPDWVRPSPAAPTPSPTATEAAPAAPTEQPLLVPSPSETPPTVEQTLPAPTETIAIAAATPFIESAPTGGAAAPPAQSPAPPLEGAAPPAVTEGPDRAFADAIVKLTNEARLASGLNPLVEAPALVAAAEEYADLHAHVSPGHLDHGLNGSTLSSRAEAEGYVGWTFLAENLAWTSFEPSLSPAEVLQHWLASPAHRDNIVNPTVNDTGVGCYVSTAEQPFRICVQDFGARP